MSKLFDELENAKESMTFKVLDEDGSERECEVLFTFESTVTGKNYIVYTDDSKDEAGNTRVYASAYDPDSDMSTLIPLETDEEFNMIRDILEELQNETEEDEDT